MLTLCVTIAIIPFALIADWFAFIKVLPPLDAELAKASHGVVMAICAAVVSWSTETGQLAYQILVWAELTRYQNFVFLACAFVAAWGLFWLVIGAARARYFQDYRLLGRAIAKIAVAGLVVYLMPREGWLFVVGCVVAGWCAVTGVTKAVLMLLPPPRIPAPTSDMPDDDFGSTRGLR